MCSCFVLKHSGEAAMNMKLWYFILRTFVVSFVICPGYGSRVVYFTVPSSSVRTVLSASPAAFGVDLTGKTPIEAKIAGAEPAQGCSDLSNGETINGKIALVDRGDCFFQSKAMKIQAVGGLAGIVIDNNPGLSARRNPSFVMHSGYGRDEVTIPLVFLFAEEAEVLLNAYNLYPDLIVGVADVVPDEVNGHWSSWSEWSRCPVTCGTGEIRRYRSCNNPSPAPGGSNCTGNSTEEERCDTGVACPAPESQQSVQRNEETADDEIDEIQVADGHIVLIVISSIIIFAVVVVSAVSVYHFCSRGETSTSMRFSVLKD